MADEGNVLEGELIEAPSQELATIMADASPELQLEILEKKAMLAPRFDAAISTILLACTHPKNWHQFGKDDEAKMCLDSAGAECVARNFSYRIFNMDTKREDFTDSLGRGYRYVTECDASLHANNLSDPAIRLIHARGVYSTRDNLLGTIGGKPRPLEDINEAHVSMASVHICGGNAIKFLLGLRGISVERYQEIMGVLGRDANKSGKVTHNAGGQGGTSAEETKQQNEMSQICMEIVKAGFMVHTSDYESYDLVPIPENDNRQNPGLADEVCITISSFVGEKGTKKGKTHKQLGGGWLKRALDKARKVHKQLEGMG